MSWNYRIVKHYDKSLNEDYYAIHECFYDDNNKDEPNACTVSPVSVQAESAEGIKWVLEKMMLALDRSIVDWTNKND